jgi:hypothetical protein
VLSDADSNNAMDDKPKPLPPCECKEYCFNQHMRWNCRCRGLPMAPKPPPRNSNGVKEKS